jgi:hypothetical protein
MEDSHKGARFLTRNWGSSNRIRLESSNRTRLESSKDPSRILIRIEDPRKDQESSKSIEDPQQGSRILRMGRSYKGAVRDRHEDPYKFTRILTRNITRIFTSRIIARILATRSIRRMLTMEQGSSQGISQGTLRLWKVSTSFNNSN